MTADLLALADAERGADLAAVHARAVIALEPQRDAAFRALDRLPILAKAHVVPAGGKPLPLPDGPPLKLPVDVDAYMAGQRSAALIIVQYVKVRL